MVEKSVPERCIERTRSRNECSAVSLFFKKHKFRETAPRCSRPNAAQSQGGGQAVQTGSSGCANSSHQSGSGGYVGCSCYASQASRR
jgi:hypothetical protein